jgi:hypothetical protein
MAGFNAVRTALAQRLASVPGLTVYAEVPDSPEVPAAIIFPGFEGEPTIRFDSTMARGSDDLLFTVVLLVQYADDVSGQDELDAYLDGSGAKSVKALIEADETLGGLVSFARVREARNYGSRQSAVTAPRYLGVELCVEITT